MKIEIKEIEGFTGYFVSTDGKIFSNLGRGNRRLYGKTVEMYELKGREAKNGYLRVYMRNEDNKRIDKYVHRLVAETFIENPQSKRVVHHIDTDRTNNAVTNLEWVTHKENNEYTFKDGHIYRCKNTGRLISSVNGIV